MRRSKKSKIILTALKKVKIVKMLKRVISKQLKKLLLKDSHICHLKPR